MVRLFPPNTGIKSSDSLRERLQSAIQRKDKPALETLIKECIAAGFPELVDDIKKARNTLDIMQGGRGGIASVLQHSFIKMQSLKKKSYSESCYS